jgi:broad specificity phosphatase PhoE
MSTLTLVRHGQASFFTADYDQLSSTGQTQARLLGEYWVRRGLAVDAVYTGPRVRQRQTAEHVGLAFRSVGLAWPDPVILEELDEYDLGGLLQRLAPSLEQEHAGFADLMGRYRESHENEDRARQFQKMFEVLTLHWLEASSAVPDVEGWPSFRARVGRGVRRMLEPSGRGRRVVAFTSGGFIGAAVRRALDAPDRVALELSWRLRNSSLTEFIFTHDRCTLDSFNTLSHLEDHALWTYR